MFEEIDFDLYENVCITGGEPFLKKDVFYSVLDKIPAGKNIYVYTNGMLINWNDIAKLRSYKIKCFNVGLHTIGQLKGIYYGLERSLPVRFSAREEIYSKLLNLYPDRLNYDNFKSFVLNDCNMPNEEWILLNNES